MNTNINNVAANTLVGRNSAAHAIRTLHVLGHPFWAEVGGVVYSSDPLLANPTQAPASISSTPAKASLVQAPTLAEVQKTKSKRRKSPRNFRQTGYQNQLAQMKEGDVIQIITTPYRPGEMQRAVCSVAHKMWGTGSYQTAVNGKYLEVMRIK